MSCNQQFCKRMTLLVAAFVALSIFAGASLCGAAGPGDGIVTDIIIGHNNKGPYCLSWTGVAPDSISVVLNGRALIRGQDYNIDLTKGNVSFNSVLDDDLAKVLESWPELPEHIKTAILSLVSAVSE